MGKVLGQDFFERSAPLAAKNLLGKFLVRRHRGREAGYMIMEVEAYHGAEDKACHGSRGKTDRNRVMFGEAGVWYVYFVYGVHWMLNITTGRRGCPSAVLIRGLISDRKDFQLDGPGKLTRRLKIDGKLNGLIADKGSGLWIEDRGLEIRDLGLKMEKGPRIGIDYAGPAWSQKPWRFWIGSR